MCPTRFVFSIRAGPIPKIGIQEFRLFPTQDTDPLNWDPDLFKIRIPVEIQISVRNRIPRKTTSKRAKTKIIRNALNKRKMAKVFSRIWGPDPKRDPDLKQKDRSKDSELAHP